MVGGESVSRLSATAVIPQPELASELLKAQKKVEKGEYNISLHGAAGEGRSLQLSRDKVGHKAISMYVRIYV